MIGRIRRASLLVSSSLCLALVGACTAVAAPSSPSTATATAGDHRSATDSPQSSTTAAPPAFRLGTAAKPFGWSTVIGDFNSDGTPDLVVADHVGRSAGRYAYRLEFSLSGTAPAAVFFESTSESLTITTVDVDHDNDLDIVVGRPLNGGAVGVWLNDGHGHFRSASVRQLPSAIGARQTLDAADRELDAAAIVAPARPHHGDLASSGAPPADSLHHAVAPRSARGWSSSSAHRSNPRGPPSSSTT